MRKPPESGGAIELAPTHTRLLHAAHSLCQSRAVTEGNRVHKNFFTGIDELPFLISTYKLLEAVEVVVSARYTDYTLDRNQLFGVTFDLLTLDERLQVLRDNAPDRYENALYQDAIEMVSDLQMTPGAMAVFAYSIYDLQTAGVYRVAA